MRASTAPVALLAALAVATSACGASTPSEPQGAPRCEAEVDAVFWGGREWVDLAKALATDQSPCAEYFVSLPPQDADLTMLRDQAAFDELRTDERIHPVAEIRFTGESGWRAWVVGPHPDWAKGRTFYEAGVEARRRMAASGLDVTRGETWALNELSIEVLEGVPGRREEIREFLRGLYEGEPGMPKVRGIVFNIFVPSDTRDAARYKDDLKAWLEDERFWSDLNRYVDFFAEEVYATPRTWGVPGTTLATRTEYLNDYLFHMLALAEAGPDEADAARAFLRRTYLPLANAAWPHPAVGTLIPAEAMASFVAAQVYAVRQYETAHPTTEARERIGFGWAPLREESLHSKAGQNMIARRLALAIRAAYEEEDGTQETACGPSGENTRCTGEIDGASLNDVWRIFATWD